MDPQGTDPESAPPPADDIAGGLRFVHLVEMETKARVAELSANLNALLEVLVGEGQLPLEAFEKRRRLTFVRENERGAAEATVAVSAVPDKYAVASPAIDCAARLPLCRARCCTLPFVLSTQDLDERAVRWDYARPYRVATRDDGLCVHNEAGACAVYAQRPAACRAYDCRKDRRIWLDFDAGIPAP
jgi:Fe-S-cluster containining protein